MADGDTNKEILALHQIAARHEERFGSVATKEWVQAALADAINRQTTVMEKMEVRLMEKSESRQDQAFKLAVKEFSRPPDQEQNPEQKKVPDGSSAAALQWASLIVTTVILIWGIMSPSGGADQAGLALDAIGNTMP